MFTVIFIVANDLDDNTVTNVESKQLQPVGQDVFHVNNGADVLAHPLYPFALDVPDSVLAAAMDFPSMDLTTHAFETNEQPRVFEGLFVKHLYIIYLNRKCIPFAMYLQIVLFLAADSSSINRRFLPSFRYHFEKL